MGIESNSFAPLMADNKENINLTKEDAFTPSQLSGKLPLIHDQKEVKVSNLREFAKVLEKLEAGKYVPSGILAKFQADFDKEGIDLKKFSSSQIQKSMSATKSCFAAVKLPTIANLGGIRPKESKQPFPKTSLTRMLTGDVKPEWLVGLGRMQTDKITPSDGYKDVFVSSLEEYEKKGIHFNPNSTNNPANMAEKLDLKGEDLAKVKKDGAWLIQIHPGSKLAIPTERKNEWNPGFVEGGYTGSDQQEWVTPNRGLDEAVRAGEMQIFKMDAEGKTEEWKFFQGKLMPVSEHREAIKAHVASVGQRLIKQP